MSQRIVVMACVACSASAQIACPFSGATWSTTGSVTIMSPATAQLTPALNWVKGAMWLVQQVRVTDFDVQYAMTVDTCTSSFGDGICLVLQSSSSDAIGDVGDGMGYGSIASSVGLCLDTFSGTIPNYLASIVYTNGVVQQTAPAAMALPSGFTDGATIQVYASYRLNTGQMNWTVTHGGGTTTFTEFVGNLQVLVGQLAWLGFTAATGGGSCRQSGSSVVWTPLGCATPSPPSVGTVVTPLTKTSWNASCAANYMVNFTTISVDVACNAVGSWPVCNFQQSKSPSATPTVSLSCTSSSTATPTDSASWTMSETASVTQTSSMSPLSTVTASSTASAFTSATTTFTITSSYTPTVTTTTTASASSSSTVSNTVSTSTSATSTPSLSGTGTFSTSASSTHSSAASASQSVSLTPTRSSTHTDSQSSTPSQSVSESATCTPTPLQTASPSPLLANTVHAVVHQLSQLTAGQQATSVMQLFSPLCGAGSTGILSFLVIADWLPASTFTIPEAATLVAAGEVKCHSTSAGVGSAPNTAATDRLRYRMQQSANGDVVVFVSATANFNASLSAVEARVITCTWPRANVTVDAVVVSSLWPVWSGIDVSTTSSSSSLTTPSELPVRLFTTPNATLRVNLSSSVVVRGTAVGSPAANAEASFHSAVLTLRVGEWWRVSVTPSIIHVDNETGAVSVSYSFDAPGDEVFCNATRRTCEPAAITIGYDTPESMQQLTQLAAMVCTAQSHRALYSNTDTCNSELGCTSSALVYSRSLWSAPPGWVPLLPASLSCPPACPSSNEYAGLLTGQLTWDDVTQTNAAVAYPGSHAALWFMGVCPNPNVLDAAQAFRVCSNASDPRSVSCMYGDGTTCSACPTGALCVGGTLMWSRPGYWLATETSTKLLACAPPALLRCPGWSTQAGTTMCGVGYLTSSVGCSVCAGGYYLVADGTCAKCEFTHLDASYLDTVAVLIAGVVCVGAGMYAVSVVCQRLLGGSTEGGVKRAIRFTVSTFVSLQLLAQIGQHVPPGVSSGMTTVYGILGNLQGDGVLVDPSCLGSSVFTMHYLRLGVALALVLLFSVARSCTCVETMPSCSKGDDHSSRRRHCVCTRAWVQRLTTTLAAALFGVITSSCMMPLACTQTTVTFLAYNQMVHDGRAANGNTQLAAALGISTSSTTFESFSAAATADPSLLLTEFSVYALSAYPAVVCWEGPHIPLVVVACTCLLLFVLGLHGWLVVLVYRRLAHWRAVTLAGGMQKGASRTTLRLEVQPTVNPMLSLTTADAVFAPGSRAASAALPLATMRHSIYRQHMVSTYATQPSSSCHQTPRPPLALPNTRQFTCNRRANAEAAKLDAACAAEVALAFYLSGDYHASHAFQRFGDLLSVLVLAALQAFIPRHIDPSSAQAWLKTVTVVGMSLVTSIVLVSLAPLHTSASWLYPFRVWLSITTAICSVFNMVASQSVGSVAGDSRLSSATAAWSYAAVVSSCLLAPILTVSFMWAMCSGARQEARQRAVALAASGRRSFAASQSDGGAHRASYAQRYTHASVIRRASVPRLSIVDSAARSSGIPAANMHRPLVRVQPVQPPRLPAPSTRSINRVSIAGKASFAPSVLRSYNASGQHARA